MIAVDRKLLFGRLNKHCTNSLTSAAGVALSRGNPTVTVEHALLKMLDVPGTDVHDVLRHYGIDASRVAKLLTHHVERLSGGHQGRPTLDDALLDWVQEGWLVASVEMNSASIRSGALLMALINRPEKYADGDWNEILEPISKEDLRKNIMKICTGSVEDDAPSAAPPGQPGAAPGSAKAGAAGQGALGQFCTNFTQRAREGKIDPVFGRDREIRQMVSILTRRRKNNPIVVGEAGVGKTAVVEGLALMIVNGEVPDVIRNVELLGLDLGLLQAGASVKGEFENRLKSVIQETKASPKPIILFIDEAHTLIGAGGAAGSGDAANLLKPALARGELRTVAATTFSEYKKYFEKDPALARRFQDVKLDEPSVDLTITMLRGLRESYEESHRVRITDEGVQAAARLSGRYISGRQLPDKAVDLLDTAAARVKIGLSSKPGHLEDIDMKIKTLEREKGARDRDRQAGMKGDAEAEVEMEAALAAARIEQAEVEARWKTERDAARRVVDLRDRLEGKIPAPAPAEATPGAPAEGKAGEAKPAEAKAPAPPPGPPAPLTPEEKEKLAAELAEAMAALQAIQGRDPLIHVEVNKEVVASVVGDWTGIPVGKMVSDEAATVLQFGETLKKRIKGQDLAIDTISKVLRSSKAGIGNPRQPMGTFLFVGPSGVGKTETALGVADLLFGGERFMTVINMSEFKEKHNISKLIGSPPGYVGYGEGGLLTEAVRQRPYSVVLLDEVEKADPEVMEVFYQVFDKGMLSDGEGREIDFKNTCIFLTSNLATDIIMNMAQGPVRPDPDELISAIRPELNRHFKPALVARMTLVPYYPISVEAMKEITKLKVSQVGQRLMGSHKITFDVDPAVIDQIAQRCTEADTGARNIDHILNGSLLPQISTELLERMSQGNMPQKLALGLDDAGNFRLDFS